MDNSLENIWKEGFLNEDALVAPKINDLYNQKSMHLIDKMMRMFRINLLMILGFAFAILVISFAAGAPFLGSILSALCIAMVLLGRKQMDQLEEIDKGSSSYEYLIAYKRWREELIRFWSNACRVFYPLIFISMMTLTWHVTYIRFEEQEMMEKFSGLHFTGDMPTLFLGIILGIAALMSIFAKKIYRWDINLVYGRVFKRLDEILAEMEELRES